MSTKNKYTATEKERDTIHFAILDFLQKKHVENVKEQLMGSITWTNYFGRIKWSIRTVIYLNELEKEMIVITVYKDHQPLFWVRYDGSINKIFDHIMTAIQN